MNVADFGTPGKANGPSGRLAEGGIMHQSLEKSKKRLPKGNEIRRSVWDSWRPEGPLYRKRSCNIFRRLGCDYKLSKPKEREIFPQEEKHCSLIIAEGKELLSYQPTLSSTKNNSQILNLCGQEADNVFSNEINNLSVVFEPSSQSLEHTANFLGGRVITLEPSTRRRAARKVVVP